jgi:hypothetical protein
MIKEFGGKQENLKLFCGFFGRTDKNVSKIKENVDLRSVKSKFRCLLFSRTRVD